MIRLMNNTENNKLSLKNLGLHHSFVENVAHSIRDRLGQGWTSDQVYKAAATEMTFEAGTFLTRKAKVISTDYDAAAKLTEDAEKMFRRNFNSLTATTESLQVNVKKVSGNVRKAADDLASGLAKVEKTANFANLERYVLLLERAATAMTTLAELEKDGKLNKISTALK